LFYRLRKFVKRTLFDTQCRGVLSTPPLALRPAPLRIVSMVSHHDLIMYLVAIKTFGHILGRGAVTTLNDGTLTESDKALLRSHVPGIDVRDISTIHTGPCPRGGCWERLMLICDLARDAYVIQLDSDTVTLGPVPEVEEQIAAGSNFTMLGRGAPERLETFAEAGERARRWSDSQKVQEIVERGLGSRLGHERYRYIRGNAAFAGFAPQSVTRERVAHFSELMRSICGAQKWNEWGSEQVTSNLIVANTPGARFLPARRYAPYYPQRDLDYERECALIHFIGLHRYENGFYARLARRRIEEIHTDRRATRPSASEKPLRQRQAQP
jgi:hypothetical protein